MDRQLFSAVWLLSYSFWDRLALAFHDLTLAMGEAVRKIRTQLLAIAAVVAWSGASYAADMAVKAPAPAPIPAPPGWTGFYIGGDVGGAWINHENYSFLDTS